MDTQTLAAPSPRRSLGEGGPPLVRLIVKKDGRLWSAWLDGECIVRRSDRTFGDGAEALLARGYDPDTLLTTRHEQNDFDTWVPAPLRVAAKHSTAARAAQKNAKAPHGTGPGRPRAATVHVAPSKRRR